MSVGDDSRSLLLGAQGELLYQTPDNIGFRVGYFGTAEGGVRPTVSGRGRQPEDTIYGPMKGVPVYLDSVYRGGATSTDEEGHYSMTFALPPCPGFTFEYTTNVYLNLFFKRFNPHGSPAFPYYQISPGWDHCNGLMVYDYRVTGVLAAAATPVARTDFPIDVMVLAGKAFVADADGGPLPIGGATRFDASRGALERVSQEQYDLDGDGRPDTTALGRVVTPADGSAPYFEQDNEQPEVQGVWLSSRHGAIAFLGGRTTTLPDLTRLPDWSADFDDRALLSSLSAEDLRDTDLYVFRESDGSLLIERRGLDADEFDFVGAFGDRERFYYTLRLVGRHEKRINRARTDAQYRQFQEAEGILNPAFYEKEADRLRAGEPVRIIVINRPSGYLGSLTVPLKSAGNGIDGEISFPIEDLVLRPPNLKIWAERQSEVSAGLTQGETREQAIGHEGAGLSDDILIGITTEWLDADGRMLPEELLDYGYTGRLAKVLSTNRLAAVSGGFDECQPACDGNQLSQFPIHPGRQLQVVRLPERVLGREHLYVQVSGTPSDRNPDFGSGDGQGPLAFRPAKFVPVKVPVFDEGTTDLALQAYHRLREEDPNRDLERPEPYYRFAYRPEFQFSVYKLKVDEIRRQDTLGETEDVFPLEQPVIASSDQLMELYYSLLGPEAGGQPLAPLEPYSYEGERELVFALGEDEIRAELGKKGEVRFENLDHLLALNPEDYLTLRLYSNNDPENILWEWAFNRGLVVTVKLPHDEMNVPAVREHRDDPPLYRLLGGLRLKYEYALPLDANALDFKWTFDRDGRFCSRYGVEPNGCIEARSKEGIDAQAIYWEPLEWTTDLNATATLQAKYTLRGEHKEVMQKFRVVTRELAPASGSDEPPEGADVAMLEQVLWQLGISPQYGSPGEQGTRLGEASKGLKGLPVGGVAGGEARRRFSSGHDMAGFDGSTEKMVRRFQGRSFGPYGAVGMAGEGQSGTADNAFLTQLRKVWRHYYGAYSDFAATPRMTMSDIPDEWWVAARGALNGSGQVPYVGTATAYNLPATYTAANHATVTAPFPAEAAAITVDDILRAWVRQESGGNFWGFGYPKTPFRIHEGGADEYGSMGFNHILWMRLYGTENNCNALRGYVGDNHNVNLYHPRNSLMVLLAAAARQDCGTANGLYRAYVARDIQSTPEADERPLAFCYERRGSTERCSNWTPYSGSDDDYDLLGKAIMLYNAGTARSGDAMVSRLRNDTASFNGSGDLIGTHYGYLMAVKQWTQTMAGTSGYLPYRTYLWRGGENADGQPWCFAYGEQEWRSGTSWDEVRQAASDADARGNPQVPVGRIGCN